MLYDENEKLVKIHDYKKNRNLTTQKTKTVSKGKLAFETVEVSNTNYTNFHELFFCCMMRTKNL
ncbi:hypothetical protein AB674_17185 [Flavobacterium sp. ABG]|nr:hypothetical protein AB674_17185 [Flavobacterium sp. ABG]